MTKELLLLKTELTQLDHKLNNGTYWSREQVKRDHRRWKKLKKQIKELESQTHES